MRVASVDIGTNSTRLLVADVDARGDRVVQLRRTSIVTRLGDGVDAAGRLSDAAVARTLEVLRGYAETASELGCEANLAVLTSAVRDASNGAQLVEQVRALGFDAQVLSGDQEAQLMFAGAMSERPPSAQPTVVIDIGGGSTELVVGHDSATTFHVSLQAGVVRMSERHLHSDPPSHADLGELAEDVRGLILAGVPAEIRDSVTSGIAVAGTATSAAAIDQALTPYDPARVHGYRLRLATVEALLARLGAMDEAQRRSVTGLHPDRAPTIVAGLALLAEALRAFGLATVEVSEHDILRGGALRLAGVV